MKGLILVVAALLPSVLFAAPSDNPDLDVPPMATFIARSCDHITMWIVVHSGRVLKLTDKQVPRDNKPFLAWIASGPVDFQEMPCTVST